MPVTIGSNIASLGIQRQLGASTDKLAQTFERLSSGMRINRASDDPAGLAVSSELRADTRVLNRATLNLNDAISVLSITDGYLDQVSKLLTRMAELSEQAASGSFSLEQRASLDEEYKALDREIRRLGTEAEFNGLNLLRSGEYNTSSEILFDGSLFASGSVLNSSRNGRYIEGGTGVTPADSVVITDTLTGELTAIEIDADIDPTLVRADLLGLTDDGKVLIRGQDNIFTPTLTRVYSYDLESGESELLIDSTTDDDRLTATNSALSADGSTFVFASQSIFENGQNALNSQGDAGGYRLYALDLATGAVKTNGTNLGADPSRVVLSSNGQYAALTDTSTTSYSINFSGDSPSALSALSSDLGVSMTSSQALAVTNEGDVIFGSSEDLVGNGNSNANLFLGNVSSGSLRQISDFSASFSSTNYELSSDGSTLFFSSNGNLTGDNADGVGQAFRYDLSLAQLEQLTSFTSSDPNVSYTSLIIRNDGQTVYGTDTDNYDGVKFTIEEEATNFDFEAGYGAAGNIQVSVDSLRSAIGTLGTNTLTSQSSALNALDDANDAIEAISDLRGRVGAGLSRINTAEQVTSVTAQQYVAADARIRDADIAVEAAALVRIGILQQAASSLLSQANQQPALALQLLQ